MAESIREIPGFYYDHEKKRYFKIEKSHTAPAEAAWSADNVKRRRVKTQETEKALLRLQAAKGHINRAPILTDPLTGCFLTRQFGVVDKSHPAAAWAAGLRDKGQVQFKPDSPSSVNSGPMETTFAASIKHVYVNGDDQRTGLGVAYAAQNQPEILGHYIPTDSHGRINYKTEAHTCIRTSLRCLYNEPVSVRDISSIKYHESSRSMLVTSMSSGPSGGLVHFRPALSNDEGEPGWLIGETALYQQMSFHRTPNLKYEMFNSCTPAPPAASSTICVLGTNNGIARFTSQGDFEEIAPERQRSPKNHSPAKAPYTGPSEFFALDYAPKEADVFYAGGRSGRLWTVDMRVKDDKWSWLPHSSSIAHVRAVDEYSVLVAGPRSAMAIYDVRYASRSTLSPSSPLGLDRSWDRNGDRNWGRNRGRDQFCVGIDNRRPWPVVTFPEYRNEAYLHIGFDAVPSLGVAAAAHDDGTVALYSLHDGRRLACPAVDRIKAPDRRPVQAIMFQTMPWEEHPSLFIGDGSCLRKISFLADQDED